jgi:hypothetical protein
VYPEVRVYADPLEGLEAQLRQLRGLIKIVPPLIDADREKRWDEISSRPSDGEDGDVIDVYSAEAGPEENWGFANFDHTIYVAAVVTAWAAFQDYLARELRNSCLRFDPSEHPALAKLVEEDVRNWDRRFDALVRRYSDFAGVGLKQLSTWEHVRHTQELRNALVHNQGQYTRAYLNTKLAYRPTKEDLHGFGPRTDDELIDYEVIPLSRTLVDGVLTQLLAAAAEVRNALDAKPKA